MNLFFLVRLNCLLKLSLLALLVFGFSSLYSPSIFADEQTPNSEKAVASEVSADVDTNQVVRIDLHDNGVEAVKFYEKVLDQTNLDSNVKQSKLNDFILRYGTSVNVIMTKITFVTAVGIAAISEITAETSPIRENIRAVLTAQEFPMDASAVIRTLLMSSLIVSYTGIFEAQIQKHGDLYGRWLFDKSINPFNPVGERSSVVNAYVKRFSVSMVFTTAINLMAIGSGTIGNTSFSQIMFQSGLEGFVYTFTTHAFFEAVRAYSARSDTNPLQRAFANQFINFFVTSAANMAFLLGKASPDVVGRAPEFYIYLIGADTNTNALSFYTSATLLTSSIGYYLYMTNNKHFNDYIIKPFNQLIKTCKSAFGYK